MEEWRGMYRITFSQYDIPTWPIFHLRADQIRFIRMRSIADMAFRPFTSLEAVSIRKQQMIQGDF